MKYFYFFLVFIHSFVFSLENSIVPTIEKTETLENLSKEKYPPTLYQKIVAALEQKENKIRCMSYNVLFNIADHQHLEENKWPNRLPRIVDAIRKIDPDIMGIQEPYQDQIDDLLAFLGDTYDFYVAAGTVGEKNGIFYKKSRFSLLDHQGWNLSPKNQKQTKALSMVHLKDLQTGKELAIFNMHFAFSNIEQREYEAHFVSDTISSYVKNIPVIFMGDLNTFPNRPDIKAFPAYDGDYIHSILKKHLFDTKEVSLLGHVGPLSTYTNDDRIFDPVTNKPLAFVGEGTPGVYLDHIYASEKVTVLIHAVDPVREKGCFPSDHMPVIIDCLL